MFGIWFNASIYDDYASGWVEWDESGKPLLFDTYQKAQEWLDALDYNEPGMSMVDWEARPFPDPTAPPQ